MEPPGNDGRIGEGDLATGQSQQVSATHGLCVDEHPGLPLRYVIPVYLSTLVLYLPTLVLVAVALLCHSYKQQTTSQTTSNIDK